MEDEMEILPQRMQQVLKTVGENAVLFQLYVKLKNYSDWNVYQNLEDKGCDIILVNWKNNNKIRIEVKTRQRLYSTQKNQNRGLQFTLSENEYKCDFLIGYWFEMNRYYIVPTEDLYHVTSKGKSLYKYSVPKIIVSKYCNEWGVLTDLLDELG